MRTDTKMECWPLLDKLDYLKTPGCYQDQSTVGYVICVCKHWNMATTVERNSRIM